MRTWAGFVPFLAVLLVGCASVEPIEGGKELEKPVTKLISLSPSTTEIVTVASLYAALKGRTSACNYPKVTLERIPVVAGVKPDYDKIAQIKPDLALYDSSLYSEADIQKLKDLGIETLEMKSGSLDEFFDSCSRLGARTGSETPVASYLDKVNAAKTAAEADPVSPKPTVAVLMAGNGTEHMISGTEGFVADVVKVAGGQPVGPGGKKFVTLNVEELIQLNPDILLTAGPADKIVTDPRLRTLKAITNRRISALNQDVVVRAGSRVDKFIDYAHKAIASRS